MSAGVAPRPALAQATNRSASLSGPSIEFVNGRWFDDTGFTRRTMYSVNGYFDDNPPVHVDTVVDLHDQYIVPPFADAHNHNVEFYGESRAKALLAKYLREGVFYDQNPDNLARARTGLIGRVNVPTGIDAIWANGGLTATGGHPTGLFQRNLGLGILTSADGDGGMLWIIDSLPDLARKWPAMLAQRPDFIKVFLLHSEEYAKRRNDTAYFNWRGLDPSLIRPIVARAHAAGLRVYAHVETAADYHNALVGGVDEIGHLPGFRGDEHGRLPDPEMFVVSDSDAALAARLHVPTITTLQGSAGAFEPNGPDSLVRRAFDALNKRNLQTLRRHGAQILVGSDNYRETSVPEALYLHSLGVFSNLELLRIWSEATPRSIFPGRRIGRLLPDYEATFLALQGNPLTDFANTTRIALRVKQGRVLSDSLVRP